MSSPQHGLTERAGCIPSAEGNRESENAPGRYSPALAWYAKAVVAATFALIFIGGLVTSHHAGMAVPDWPLSYGSLNPDGWWNQLPVRLEHGHRLFAMFVGLLVGVLCAWIWQSWRALLIAALVSGVVPQIAAKMGASEVAVMHLRIWPAAAAFLGTVLIHSRGRKLSRSPAVLGLAIAAFVSVCLQATLGGLRVTQETAGLLDSALLLRIAHGVFGQTFLCINVALAVMLAGGWKSLTGAGASEAATGAKRWAWLAFAAIYFQLIFGAVMRHMGAGLAITTFPEASADGSWLPPVHNKYVDVNFMHTRVGAILVTVLVVITALYAIRHFRTLAALTRPAWALLGLVFVQFGLGMFVIWHAKPRTLTTLHVANGAALLAVTLLLALRASKVARSGRALKSVTSL